MNIHHGILQISTSEGPRYARLGESFRHVAHRAEIRRREIPLSIARQSRLVEVRG